MKNCFHFLAVLAFVQVLSSCSGTKNTSSSTSHTSSNPGHDYIVTAPLPRHTTPQQQQSQPVNSTTQLNISAVSVTDIQNKYGQLLGIDPALVQNIRLYKFIDSWYHTPYKYAGRSKSGIDCSDFVSVLIDSVYNIVFDGSSASMFSRATPIKKNDLREGDLVFFKISGNHISHVGFYLTNNKFVHASVSSGIVISDLTSDYYKKYFYSGGRITLN